MLLLQSFIQSAPFSLKKSATSRKMQQNHNIFSNIQYSPFNKTLPICSLQMHWISVRFYEMGDNYAF